MKRFAKILGTTCVAALALGLMTAAGASAAQFTFSATGTLEGTQTSNQVFTASSSSPAVVCEKAASTGTITSTGGEMQEFTVNYSSCTIPALSGAAVSNITATYDLHADGTVKIIGNIVISVPGLGCSTTVSEQEVSSVSYDNVEVGGVKEVEETSAVTGIHSTSTGFCPSGTTGTYTGNNLVHRVGGGTISWDA
jgi:hypothetical protein